MCQSAEGGRAPGNSAALITAIATLIAALTGIAALLLHRS